jgi:hypothetical protein
MLEFDLSAQFHISNGRERIGECADSSTDTYA